MKKNRNIYHAGRIISLLLVLCMVLSIAPITAFAGVEDITGGTTSNVYKHTYHTKVKMTANVTVQDGEGNTVNTYQVSEESDFLVGNISDDAVQAEITRLEGVVNSQLPSSAVKSNRTTNTIFDHFESSYILESSKDQTLIGDNAQDESGTTSTLDVHEYQIYEITDEWTVKQDDYVIHKVVINNAPVSCTVGEAPKAMATKGDNGAYTFYEYWEEWAQTENGLEPVKFWYSDAEQMNRVPADQRITAFEEGKTYSYSVIAQANENYTFASKDDGLSVMLNGKDFIAKSEMIWDGKSLMIGPGAFMTPTTPVEQKEIVLIEINNATVSFKAGDEPVFTGTTPDGAPYVLDFEGWFGEDGKFISSSEYWNSAYVERGWCDGLISSFKENTEYTYGLYVKLTDEAAARGYVFGPNTNLKINGKDAEYVHSDETSIALQIMSKLTMTPGKTATQKEIPVVEINNATLTFKDGDKPVFTGTTPDGAPYVLVFEEWRTDGEWTRSDEWFNDADHHGDDKDITAFDKNKSYNYNLYLKTTAEGSEEGWYFGQNTKLKINGKEVSFTNNDPDVFMATTGITMTPTAAGASDYKIVERANGTWTQNSDGTLVFRANGDFSKFTGVKVDGTLIDAKNYTAVSGSTVVTLKADYLKTLSVGTHKLTVAYTDGECSTNFEIKASQTENGGGSEPEKVPQTGDNSNMLLWVALLCVSGFGIIGTIVYSKKKRVK